MLQEDFKTQAASLPDPFRLLIRESVTSTNDELRKLAEDGAHNGVILLAENQTAGRGRRGAPWFSQDGLSLAFSVLLRPPEPVALWPRFALAAGLAVAEAIESQGLQPGIKWPNDVWIAGKKVAGILVESGRDFVILGIGINVNTQSLPSDLTEIATSLYLQSGYPLSRASILHDVIHRLCLRKNQIDQDFETLLQAVRLRCVLTGNPVSLISSNGPKTGLVSGISGQGELLLQTPTGLEKIVQADEIRLIKS